MHPVALARPRPAVAHPGEVHVGEVCAPHGDPSLEQARVVAGRDPALEVAQQRPQAEQVPVDGVLRRTGGEPASDETVQAPLSAEPLDVVRRQADVVQAGSVDDVVVAVGHEVRHEVHAVRVPAPSRPGWRH